MNVEDVAASITEPREPVVVAEANGFQMKVVRLHGQFRWHVHERQDELFYCAEGTFRIEQIGAATVRLRPGDVLVVPAGRRHRPVAEAPAVAVLFEPAATKQYGD